MKKFLSLFLIASMLFCSTFLSSCSEPTKWKVTFEYNGNMVRVTYKYGNSLTETWYNPKNKISISSGVNGSSDSSNTNYVYVEDGEYLSDPGSPKKPSSIPSFSTEPTPVFTGWYLDKACTQPFDFNQPIHNNLTLYAGWVILKPVDFDTGKVLS